MKQILILVTLFFIQASVSGALTVVWPTENPPTDLGSGLLALYQATESREVESGGFGCVREKGLQFHEGLDLRSFTKDAKGEATDAILAAMDGRIVYRNSDRSKSSFGRYLLIEHNDGELSFITLYAHLRSFEKGIGVGVLVNAGQRIATMGRSANHSMPKARAHLHFEVCLRLTDDFQGWYNWKQFDSKNDHGIYNGMNLVGIDPVLFFQETWYGGDSRTLRDVLDHEKTAFTITVSTDQIPDYIRRNSALLKGEMPTGKLGAWKIDYTWYGIPKLWTPVVNESGKRPTGKLSLSDYNRALMVENGCRRMFDFRNGKPVPGSGLKSNLQLIFGFR